jgi:uncharacterized protein (DUF1015 family)
VRLVLPEHKDGSRDYNKAKQDLSGWAKKGILKQDRTPTLYVYLQEYKIGDKLFSRYGILSLLKLESDNSSSVLPHENIFSKPFLDRVRLMKKTKAHLSPIFLISRDRGGSIYRSILGSIKRQKPDADIYFEDVRHKLWRIDKRDTIGKLTKQINSSMVFIADGHHRFAASAAVKGYFDSINRKTINDNGHSYTLVYIVSSKDKGLLILPTHRAVRVLPKGFSAEYMTERLKRYFEVKFIHASKVKYFLGQAASKKECAFVIFYKDRYLAVLLKDKAIIKDIGPKKASCNWKRLDVSVLHNLVFKRLLGIKEKIGNEGNIYYYKDSEELARKVRSGEQQLGVFLNPSTMDEVESIAEKGEKMPHKSTYFYPKPLTGLVIHKF